MGLTLTSTMCDEVAALTLPAEQRLGELPQCLADHRLPASSPEEPHLVNLLLPQPSRLAELGSKFTRAQASHPHLQHGE